MDLDPTVRVRGIFLIGISLSWAWAGYFVKKFTAFLKMLNPSGVSMVCLVQRGWLVGWRNRSGWGMRPRILPVGSQRPAMWFVEPLGFMG